MTSRRPDGAARSTRLEPLARLATGGMAEIWLAREQGAAGLERFVVLKRLLPHLAREEEVVDMFVSEARFIARLAHPNVVQIHELAEDDQGYFLVMEYVAGCSVRELMSVARKAEVQLSPDVAICIVEQACRGAHAAHELTDSSGKPLGLVHRDISPHNLMIGPDGDVKLLDFGIAKATLLSEATHTRSLKGKCGYMSPEQCRSTRLDRRSDVFALGVVAWELLVGDRLFARESDFASMEAIVSGQISLPSAVRMDLPRPLDAVIAKALAKSPEARWQTADELRRALVAAAEESGLKGSRDILAATMQQLLGERLDQRQRALHDVAMRTAPPDEAALHDVLVGTDPQAQKRAGSMSGSGASGSGVTGRSRREAQDEEATVAQRRSGRPPPDPEADGVTLKYESSEDERTLAETPASGMPPGARGRRRTDYPLEPPPHSATLVTAPAARPVKWLVLAIVILVAATAAVIVWRLRGGEAADAARSAATDEPVLTGPPLRMLLAPSVQPEVMTQEMAPFARWLGRSLDRPVEILVASSYEDCGQRVSTGAVELALLPPLLFLQTVAREPRVQPLALRLYEGSRGSDGYMLVRDDVTLKEAKELKGRTICLVDRESTTGFLLPRIWMREAGMDPEKDVKTILSGDHLAAMRDLAAGRCDAAAVYSGAYLSARDQGIRVGGMRVLAITGHVPQDVVVAAPTVAEAAAKDIARLLIGFDAQRDVDAGRIGAVLGITGFAAFDAGEFTLIREAARNEGLMP